MSCAITKCHHRRGGVGSTTRSRVISRRSWPLTFHARLTRTVFLAMRICCPRWFFSHLQAHFTCLGTSHTTHPLASGVDHSRRVGCGYTPDDWPAVCYSGRRGRGFPVVLVSPLVRRRALMRPSSRSQRETTGALSQPVSRPIPLGDEVEYKAFPSSLSWPAP